MDIRRRDDGLIGDVTGLVARGVGCSDLLFDLLDGLSFRFGHPGRTLPNAQHAGNDADKEDTGRKEVPPEGMGPILLPAFLDPGPHVLRHRGAVARQFLPQGIVHSIMLLLLHLLTIMPLA